MFLCQFYKIVESIIVNKRFDKSVITTSGGMPSSHTASVSSLSTALALQEGMHSTIFQTCLIFAFVVIYDAVGVRRAAGKQAEILNEVVQDTHPFEIKLKEELGHTPKEVIVGAILGILIAVRIKLWIT